MLFAVLEQARAFPGRVALMDRDRREGGDDRPRLRRLQTLRRWTAEANLPLVVNQRCDLAAAVDADGVQLPERGLTVEAVRRAFPALGIGRSCHSREGLLRAAEAGADWATLAPIFTPTSKPLPAGVTPLGDKGFREATEGLPLPTFALGGITAQNACKLSRVAVIGAVLLDESPAEALIRLLETT